jgi:two-component system LytT family response regulator
MTPIDRGHGAVRAVIVEDDAHARTALLRLLAELCPQIRVAGTCGRVDDAVRLLREPGTDIVFLDVELPDGTGFDVLQQLGPVDFSVIFTTAHVEYAVRAIKFSALDYLLKPVAAEELMAAVAKASSPAHGREQQGLQLRLLQQHLAGQGEGMARIVLPTQEGYSFIPLEDIVWCEAQNNYTDFHLLHGSPLPASRTLKEFEELLEPNGFCRIHHSHLINLRHLVKYVKGKGGYVVMSTGKELEVSVRRKEDFLARIKR